MGMYVLWVFIGTCLMVVGVGLIAQDEGEVKPLVGIASLVIGIFLFLIILFSVYAWIERVEPNFKVLEQEYKIEKAQEKLDILKGVL